MSPTALATRPAAESPRRPPARRSPPLVPDAIWPYVCAVLPLLAGTFCVLALATWHKAYPLRPELWVIRVVDDPRIPGHVYRLGLWLGSPRFFAAIVVGLGVFALVNRRWKQLVCCASVPVAVVLVEQVLKPAIDRHIADGFYSFPSGTATGVAAWTTLAWIIAVPALRDPLARFLLAGFLAVLTGITAVAVVGAHWHYPFDAVAGVCTGVGVVLGFAVALDVVTGAHRPWQARAVAASG